MSFFKKMLASVGIGNAKVDTVLDSAEVPVGGDISGVVYIQGGQVEQQVDRIYLFLKSEYIREHDDRKVRETATITKFLLTERFTLRAGERKEVPFRFTLPEYTPVTLRSSGVWIETGLDIPSAADATDRDALNVTPSDEIQVALDAIELLGFRLREVTNDYAPRLGGPLPFVQEFEYVPTTKFRGHLDELEVLFRQQHGDLELLLEVDRRARGLGGFFSEAMGTDESLVRLNLSRSDLGRGPHHVADILEDTISRYAH
ncbi:sporulation protein [Saccharibacillus alkalitolerans]|uniref:Sporulation protein n=1 Tax=Saccharibacillus alkalitolerans TaxID=2705290 RepID=A0ABX0F8P7_9BACL|nr:sporulation protein [Saccharibacillus alkalitolerans]NGZ76384.1 sporulation protein [Saccharibacillus alkalitolerans]